MHFSRISKEFKMQVGNLRKQEKCLSNFTCLTCVLRLKVAQMRNPGLAPLDAWLHLGNIESRLPEASTSFDCYNQVGAIGGDDGLIHEKRGYERQLRYHSG